MKKIMTSVLLIVEIIMIIFVIAFFIFDFSFKKHQEEAFVEIDTNKSKYFYNIQEIYYFDKHIFCYNYSQNSITILDEDGNCKKEIKFQYNDGHPTTDLFLFKNKLYVFEPETNTFLKYNKWNSYERNVSLNQDEKDRLKEYYNENPDKEKLRITYVDKNNYYKVNKSGTELFKVEGNKETLIKQSTKSDLSRFLDNNIDFIIVFICIFVGIIVDVIRQVILEKC